jgi:hypothetical protein
LVEGDNHPLGTPRDVLRKKPIPGIAALRARSATTPPLIQQFRL